jgi:ABC-type bacteriocin/lantibiotic exporter with double-glycine peptidase domain
MDAIFRFCEHRTLVFMTHRLGRIQEADHIVVLAEGKVAEQGNFKNLAYSGGLLSQFLALPQDEIHFSERP